MDTLSSGSELSSEGLSEAQIALLDSLKEAGPGGIHWSDFLRAASEKGVHPDVFGNLIERKLIAMKAGGYIHPDFTQQE